VHIWHIGEVIIFELTNNSAQRKINPINGFELLEVQNVNPDHIDHCTKGYVKLDGIEKLLNDLSGDKPKEVVDSAIKKLMELEDDQVKTDLVRLIEDAVRKAAFQSDFIWLAFIKDIVQEKGLEEFLKPKTIQLLNFEELMLDIQF